MVNVFILNSGGLRCLVRQRGTVSVCRSNLVLQRSTKLTAPFNRPITTYSRRATTKPGVVKSHHAIIYTDREPDEIQGERRTNSPPMLTSIRVAKDDPSTMLDPLSRINYSEVYTVQLNVKVKAFGWIHPNFRHLFDGDSRYVLERLLFQQLATQSLNTMPTMSLALPSYSNAMSTSQSSAPASTRRRRESDQSSSSIRREQED